MIKKNLLVVVLLVCSGYGITAMVSHTQVRMDNDIAAAKPIVIHVSVALADNKNQWIVPVPEKIGNGQDARTNLYWGAMYGLKTYLLNKADWSEVASVQVDDKRILERLVLKKRFHRKQRQVTVYLVADAWNGKYIEDTIKQFMRYNAGSDVLKMKVGNKELFAGGMAHLIVYIGHNALMDYGGAKGYLVAEQEPAKDNPDNDSIVLACKSRSYFLPRLEKVAAHPVVLTTGLLAPEAYTLQAAIEKWIAGADDNQIRKAAARSYNKYQKTGIKAAERLFGVQQ